MSKISKMMTWVFVGFFILGFAGGATAQTTKHQFRMGQVTPLSHGWHKTALKVAELVDAKTKGV
jgi:TRAP-type C4-dicarboxylate transport system substrate-binding protein